MNQYHKLYTPADSVVVFVDHQPQMTFGVASIDRATLINNVTLLAKVAKVFNVPAVLTAVETESFSGYVCDRPPVRTGDGPRTGLSFVWATFTIPSASRCNSPPCATRPPAARDHRGAPA